MSWTLERRSFWVERAAASDEWRPADHRTIIGPLYVYTWRWLHTSLGGPGTYSLRRLRPWRTGRLRGPLFRRSGHPWGLRIRWNWRGWSGIGPPWNLNIWNLEPEDLSIRDEPYQQERDW